MGVGIKRLAFGLDDHQDIQIVFFGEIKIPLVVGRNGHDRAGPVFHEGKIGRIDGHSSAASRD